MISNEDEFDARVIASKYLNDNNVRNEYIIPAYKAFVAGYLAALRDIDNVDVRVVCQNTTPV